MAAGEVRRKLDMRALADLVDEEDQLRAKTAAEPPAAVPASGSGKRPAREDRMKCSSLAASPEGKTAGTGPAFKSVAPEEGPI